MNYIITGSSQGIGFEVSKILENGNNLLLCSRKKNNYFDNKKNVKYLKLDVNEKKDLIKLKNYLKINKISLNGVIFSHGLLGTPMTSYNLTKATKWKKIFDTNFTSSVNLIRYIVPFIKKKNYSKIIFFSGGGAFNAWPIFSAYSVAKTALVRFAENLADELKNQKIIVTCLAPGFINTDIHKLNYLKLNQLNKKYKKELIQNKNKKPNFENIIKLVSYTLQNKNMNLSGKTISANYDPWGSKLFLNKLKKNNRLLTLARINLKPD